MSDMFHIDWVSAYGCELCDKRGVQPMRTYIARDGAVLIGGVCNECEAARVAAALRQREAALLADWGTRKERRTA